MFSNASIGSRFTRALVSVLVVVLSLCCFIFAQADVESVTRSGSISQLRLYDDSISAGTNARFKLTIKSGGTVVATLTDESTDKSTTVLNKQYGYAQNVLLTVPGKLLKDGDEYTLDVKLLSGKKNIGTASAKIKLAKATAEIQNLSVSANMNPSGARLLSISFRLPSASNVTAVVRNSSGTKVSTVLSGAAYAAGTHTVSWNGILSSGSVAPCGRYTLEIYCKNTAGTSATRTASFEVQGASSKATAGSTSGTLSTLVLASQPKTNVDNTIVFHSTKSGAYLLKVTDKTSGQSWIYHGKMNAGIKRVTVPGSCFSPGNKYTFQLVTKSGSSTVGKGEVSATAYIAKPSITSVTVGSTLRAGHGASLPITYTLGENCKVTLYIRGSDGKVITTFVTAESQKAGTHTAYWNGLTSGGSLLSSGQYRITVACSNAAGTASVVSEYFTYTGKVSGMEKPYTSGAIRMFGSAGDPMLAERTPADMLIKTTKAGTLKIVLTRKDTGAQALVYNAYLSAGTNTVTIPAKYLRNYTYQVKASLYSGSVLLGEAVAWLQPQKVSPSVSNFECDETFDTTWTPAIRGYYDTASSGYQHVIVKNTSGAIVRSIGGGAYSASGHQTFSWDGRGNDGEYVADGTYTIYVNYHDDYGKYSNYFKQVVKVDLNSYPDGVYGYAIVGKGDHKTAIAIYNKPNGTVKTTTYGISASFTVLEDLGEWLYVEASCPSGAPQKGYVLASALQKVTITSPWRIEICISRTGAKAQKMWVYKNDKLVDTFDISSGISEGSTPTGTFILLNRKPYFKVLSGNGICYDALRICGGSCIHRIPLLYGSYASAAAKLGTVASHGCVRVPYDKSQWLYDTIPDTTPIVIFYAN